MRPRAALVESADRRRKLRPAGRGAKEKQLMQRQLAGEDVALGETGDALDIEWRDDLAMQNLRFESRREALDRIHDRVPECLALRVGPAAVQFVGRVLYEDRHDVLAGRRHARIDHRGEHDVHVGPARELAVLRVVVRALDIVEAGTDRERTAVLPADARHAAEAGQRIERQVHLARRTAELEALDIRDELRGQLIGLEQLEEGSAWIEARHDNSRRQLVTVFQHDASGPAVTHEDLRNTGIAPDLSPERAGGGRDGFAHRARAPFRKPPGSEHAVQLAHVMMQEHVRGPWRPWTQERADDAARRLRRLEDVRLEPL